MRTRGVRSATGTCGQRATRRPRRWRRRRCDGGCAIALVLALCAASACAPIEPPDGLVRLDRARFLLVGPPRSASEEGQPLPAPPPDEAAGWQAISLPDRWRERRPDRGGWAWYRFELPPLPVTGEPLGILLPELNMNAAVFVNGELVGAGGRMHEPVAQHFHRPLLVSVPSSLLARPPATTERASSPEPSPGDRIDVLLYAHAHHFGALAPIEVGPLARLLPRYERLVRLQHTLARLATAVVLLTALFVAALWIGTRFDPLYGTFVATSLLWAVASLNYWVRDLPFAHWTWERLVHGAIDGFAIGLALWAHRLLGLRRVRLERALLAFGAVAWGLIAVLPAARFHATVNALHAGALAIGTYAAGLVLWHLRRLHRVEAAGYALAATLGVGLAVHDLGIQLGVVDRRGPFLIVYIVPLLLLAFGATLLARFVASLRQSERMQAELERSVREKHAELEQSYQRLHALERERLLASERERIMREMHDGVGGRLVSALALVEGGRSEPREVAAALRAALDDMRLVIDSIDPEVSGLEELLGMLRARLEGLLRRHGLRLVWRASELPPTPEYGPEEYLHVLRMVQEAVTNVVKHAHATQVTIESRRAGEDGIVLTVCDDGVGLVAPGAPGARGLANLRQRAAALGGTVCIERVPAPGRGTCVTLRLSVRPAACRERDARR